MATPIEYVDEQWTKWQEKNSVVDHIDTEELKDVLVKDLSCWA